MRQYRWFGFAVLLVGLFLLVLRFALPVGANPPPLALVVTKTADTNDGTCDNDCSLREAISAANLNAGADTITFNIPDTDPNCTAANVCTITLTSALPTIDQELAIDGTVNAAQITVSGDDQYPILFANGGAPLAIDTLTLTNGYTTFHGGAVYAGDTLVLIHVTVQNSTSEQTGGGIAAEGAVVISDSTISGNTAASGGGANLLSTANISNSTFSGNETDAGGNGGGAYFNGAATLENVIFDDNTAGTGGGGGAVFHDTAELTGGAFTNNKANFAGGGAYFENTADIDGTTFFNNQALANRGGGAYFNGAATVNNVLFNGNHVSADRGGGAYFRQSAQISATDFITNTASNRAGGAYFNSNANLTDTNFYTNTATARAGGAYFGGAANVQGGILQGNECTGTCLGGGAYVANTLVLTDTQFIDNSSDSDGGGAFTNVNSTFTHATFRHNQAANTGGGLAGYGTNVITGSTFENNQQTDANGSGGAIFYDGTMTIGTSTFTENASVGGLGGAIYQNNGAGTINNSTFDGNSAKTGGAIYMSEGSLDIINSTFTANTTTFGAAMLYASSGTTNVTNTTAAGNLPAANNATLFVDAATVNLFNTLLSNGGGGRHECDVVGVLNADAYNIASDDTCNNATVKTAAQINVAALADNGGPTKTMALKSGSAALDAGNDTACADVDTVNNLDQRGVARPQGVHCDVGAFEAGLIQGQKFNDLNANGVKDNGEKGIANWSIDLRDTSDALLDTTTTDATGNYTLTVGALPFTYRVREVLQNGWEQKTANPADLPLTIASPNASNILFGNVQPADVQIVKEYQPKQNGSVVFTLTIDNAGTGTARRVRVRDVIPAKNWAFASVSTSQGMCKYVETKQRVQCKLGSLKAGGTAIVTLVIAPIKSAIAFENCALVRTKSYEPDTSNNTSCVSRK